MPKKNRKNKLKKTEVSPRQPFLAQRVYRELTAFVLLMLTVFLGLALYSYDPLDPSFNTLTQGDVLVENYGGVLGSHVADILMQSLGYVSYVLLALLMALSVYLVSVSAFKDFGIKVTGSLLLLWSSALAFSLWDTQIHHPNGWGGIVGYYSAGLLSRYLGLGIYLVMVLGGVGSFLMISRLPLSHAIGKVGRGLMLSLFYVKQSLSQLLDRLSFRLFGGRPSIDQSKEREWKLRKAKENLTLKAPQASSDISEASHDRAQGARELKDIPIVVKTKRSEENDKKEAGLSDLQVKYPRENTDFELPPSDLLDQHAEQEIHVDKEELLGNAQVLEAKLKDFGVRGRVVEVQPGPVVTMYEFEPAPGIKVNQITRLEDDLTLALRALSVRITLLPGKSVVGVEVANRDRQVVYFKDVVENKGFSTSASILTMGLGKDISGEPFVADLRKMPHLLVAGATGSGKSVAINSMITSILYRSTPKQVRMILVDPKMLELSLYDHIPHLLLPVVTDPRKAAAALRWAVAEMEQRYRLMADIGVRNIEGYNQKIRAVLDKHAEKSRIDHDEVGEPITEDTGKLEIGEHSGELPFIVIVIDELADLMMVSSRDVEESIIRLAQMARAAGIHLILATQRPSVDVITGVIKANMPSRISFQVSSKIDSRTIIDSNGAEMLLGAGDMLYLPPGTSKLLRVHGAFISDDEVERVTHFWKNQAKPNYQEEILQCTEDEAEAAESTGDPDDDLYQNALALVQDKGVASISMIQRRLRIGYNRAARLVERMDDEGLLAPGEVGKPRELRSIVGM